jgi:hypothetical protein
VSNNPAWWRTDSFEAHQTFREHLPRIRIGEQAGAYSLIPAALDSGTENPMIPGSLLL